MLRKEISRWDTLIQRDSWLIFSPNSLMLLALLLCRGKLMFAVLMSWFEGGVCVLSCIFVSFYFSVIFSSYSPKLTYFTCYTSLYFDDYVCHYTRVSRKPSRHDKNAMPTSDDGRLSLKRATVIPRSEIAETKPPYVCPGCLIHTYSNNMINRCHVQ
jgi:hypothetical protein